MQGRTVAVGVERISVVNELDPPYTGQQADFRPNDTDNDSNIDHKKIKSISLRSGDVLDGISLGFTDGSSTPWRGGQGGVASQFILADGETIAIDSQFTLLTHTLDEDITQVAVSHSGTQIQRLKFITSNGRSHIRKAGVYAHLSTL